MRAKLDGVLHALQARQGMRDAGKEAMQRTRQEVAVDWQATADELRRHGKGELAARVERFVARMPPVQTDAQRMAERWREAERSRVPEHEGIKRRESHVR